MNIHIITVQIFTVSIIKIPKSEEIPNGKSFSKWQKRIDNNGHIPVLFYAIFVCLKWFCT